eukprot:5160462-Alexandrium_andersonii.AAC.1
MLSALRATCCCKSAPPQMHQEIAAHGAVTKTVSEMVSRPPSLEALARRSPWPPPTHGCSVCATLAWRTFGGAELHMQWPGCMRVGAPPGGACPVVRGPPAPLPTPPWPSGEESCHPATLFTALPDPSKAVCACSKGQQSH